MRRAMVNTWSSWRRRKWRSEHPSGAVPDGPAAGDLAAEAAARVAVRGALGRLTDRQRAVLVLRVFDDLSEAQVAQVLNCAIGTVKSRWPGPWPGCVRTPRWLNSWSGRSGDRDRQAAADLLEAPRASRRTR